MKRLLCVLLLLSGCGGNGHAPATPAASNAPVPTSSGTRIYTAWLPSPDPSVLGYRIYYGPSPDQTTAMIADTQDTQDSFDWQVDLGGAPTVCFRVAAYNADGETSALDGVCLTP